MKHYSPTGRKSYGRPLKRLLDTWDRRESTSGPTPWQIYDEDEDDDDDDDVCTFTVACRWVASRMVNISDKVAERCRLSVTIFWKSAPLWNNMITYEAGMPQIILVV
jgi:hypothetical protein